MTTEELYKLKTELEVKAFQIWQTSEVNCTEETDDLFCIPLEDYAVLLDLSRSKFTIVYYPSLMEVKEDLEFDYFESDIFGDDRDLAFACCLGLQQAKDNANTEEKFVEKTLFNKEWNRSITIKDLTSIDGHPTVDNYYAQIIINRPLDSGDGKSSSLAYPLSKEEIISVKRVLEGILENMEKDK